MTLSMEVIFKSNIFKDKTDKNNERVNDNNNPLENLNLLKCNKVCIPCLNC